jgi:dTDP-4-amino-4,6-dideoxy-D-galactose acyltransferase
MIINCKPLKWDSDFFGYPVGQVDISDFCENDYDEFKRVLKDWKFVLIYIYPADEETLKALLLFNIPLVDIKITFEKEMIYSVPNNNLNHIESYSKFEQYDVLKKLALSSGEFSRFKIDTNFKNNEFAKLYEEWLNNSINREIADDVIVVKIDNKIKGFATYKLKNNDLIIGLISVDPTVQGKGLGKTLMREIENIAIKKMAGKIQVVTQGANTKALLFYKSCGYKIAEKKEILHLWIQ